MIAFLEGTVELKGEKFVVLGVGGVGYKVFSGPETIRALPERGGRIRVWTHQHVREDALDLYGFSRLAEVEFFELLIGISGIGPKGAMGVMDVAPVDTLKKAIAAGDTSYLTRVSGVGKKLAEKIILELKDKMAGKGVTVDAPELQEEADVLDALIALGYSQREAREALERIPQDVVGMEQRVREVLRLMNTK